MYSILKSKEGNDITYDYSTFVKEINRYTKQQRNSSNQKANMYLQILFASIVASSVKK